jgi:hypothetical protein
VRKLRIGETAFIVFTLPARVGIFSHSFGRHWNNPQNQIMASFHSPYSYSEIDTSDTESLPNGEKTPCIHDKSSSTLRLRFYLVISIIAALLFTTTAGFAMGRLFSSSGKPETPLPRLSCGNSSAEAESLGCTFDPLSVAWLHQDCPRDGTEEFLHYREGKEWHYWYDEAGLEQIPDYDAMSRIPHGQVYYTKSIEHLTHCTWMAVRAARVRKRGGRLDSLATNMRHAEHCAKYLLKKVAASEEELEILEAGDVGFLHC